MGDTPTRVAGLAFLRSGPTTFAVVCAAVAGLISAKALFGWVIGDYSLVQVGPTVAPMRANTALCFLCGSLALMAGASGDGVMGSQRGRRILIGLGLFLLLVPGLTITQHVFQVDLGVDSLLFDASAFTPSTDPGPMSPWTALGFIVTGTVVLLGVTRPAPGSPRFTLMAFLTGFVGVLASVVIAIYVLEVDVAPGAASYTRMAVPTASLFWILALGTGITMVMGSPVARRMLQWAPVFLGLLVTLVVRQELIDRDRLVRTTGTEDWIEQTSLHALGLLQLRVEALEGLAEEVAGGSERVAGGVEQVTGGVGYRIDRILNGHTIGVVDSNMQLEWSTSEGAQRLALQRSLDRPEARALAFRSAAAGVSLMSSPDLRPGTSFQALVFSPVVVEGRAPRFVVGVMDYRSTMILDGIVGGYRLGLVVDGVPVLDAGSVGADEAEASAFHSFAGRTLAFHAAPSDERIAASASRLPGIVLMTGLAFALLLAWSRYSAQAHERSEARFRALLESAPDAGVIVDEVGRIVDVNSRAENLFGALRSDLSGTSIGMLGGGTKLTRPVMDWDWNDPFELVVPRGALPDLPLEVTASPIQTDDGLLVSMSLRDMTERNALIDRLRESDRLKSEFVSTVSHEMRTPLAVIREFSSLLHDGVAGPVNGDQTEFLDTVLRNCDRLTGLVGDLLELAQMKSGKYRMDRQQIDLTPVLERAVQDLEALAATKKQILRLDVRGPLPDVLCDPDRVTQVLVNLVGNAHKFTHEKGEITIHAERQGTSVAIAVQDTGVGIAEEHQAQIFGAFVQVGREEGPGPMGTGLGLNVARQIVEFHGGRLTVESCPGEGSTFTFTLPALDEDPLTGFLAPHLDRHQSAGTSFSLLRVRDTAGDGLETVTADGEYLDQVYDTVVAMQRVGGDEALRVRKQNLVMIALVADEEGSLGFVRRLLAKLDGAGERLEFAIWTLDPDSEVMPSLGEPSDQGFRPLLAPVVLAQV